MREEDVEGANASVADTRCLSAGGGPAEDATLVARAIVAACARAGVDPMTAFDPPKSGQRIRSGTYARILAAQALRRRGFAAVRLKGLLKLTPPDLSPTGAERRGIMSEDVDAVLAGLDDPRSVTPRLPRVRTRAARPKPEPRAGAARAARVSRARPTGPKAAWMAEVGTRRVRAVTPRVIRYGAWFLEAGWDPSETAALFDVDEDALISALENDLEAA